MWICTKVGFVREVIMGLGPSPISPVVELSCQLSFGGNQKCSLGQDQWLRWLCPVKGLLLWTNRRRSCWIYTRCHRRWDLVPEIITWCKCYQIMILQNLVKLPCFLFCQKLYRVTSQILPKITKYFIHIFTIYTIVLWISLVTNLSHPPTKRMAMK